MIKEYMLEDTGLVRHKTKDNCTKSVIEITAIVFKKN